MSWRVCGWAPCFDLIYNGNELGQHLPICKPSVYHVIPSEAMSHRVLLLSSDLTLFQLHASSVETVFYVTHARGERSLCLRWFSPGEQGFQDGPEL